MASDDVASAVPHELETLLDRRGGSGRLDCDVHAFAVGHCADALASLDERRALKVEGVIGAHPHRE